MYVIYLETGIGLSGGNLKVLEKMLQHIISHGVPWVAVGDWKVDPEEVMQQEWVQRMGCKVMAPPEPTCHVGEQSEGPVR